MTLPTASEITNWFLYGGPTRPSNIQDEGLIRGPGETSELHVDVNEFMEAGGGRIVNPAFFSVVSKFFSDSDDLISGQTYTLSQVLSEYGFGSSHARANIQQRYYYDGVADYAERTYIWNSSRFEIDDGALFVIDPNGDRRIENLSISPFGNENFDFKSNDWAAQLGNVPLNLLIDPSNIGRTVNIIFDGERPKGSYSNADYVQDIPSSIPNVLLLSGLPTAMALLIDGLYEADINQQNGKTVIYGTDSNDSLNGTSTPAGLSLYLNPWLAGSISNGISYTAGDGNDSVVATDYADILYGGSGIDSLSGKGGQDVLKGENDSDTLEGGTGGDTLEGGSGKDVYVWNAGDGNDTIIDPDGGKLIIKGNGFTFAGGVMTKDASSNIWHDASGNVTLTQGTTWQLSLSDGTVFELGSSFNPVQWGIELKDAPAPPGGTFTGDYGKLISSNGVSYLFDSLGNYQVDPELPLGPQPDAVTGTSGGDTIDGGALNDALSGLAGDDSIEGGSGDDILSGGLGSDTLNGGEGDDHIYGSGLGGQSKPPRTDSPPPTAGGPEVSRGLGWVVYDGGTDSNGRPFYVVNGVDISTLASDEGNVIDGGGGDDSIEAGSGNDYARGGEDADDISGLAGDDILSGDGGNDRISGDGIIDPAYVSYTPPAQHGVDIIDGGAGNDDLLGQGNDDVLFGGTGDDRLWGDESLSGDSATDDTPASVHGDDYLDGGDNDDYLEGGGRDDFLVGGSGQDTLFGDGGVTLTAEFHGSDFLDGGSENDALIGGGGDDTLLGGSGNDTLQGDTSTDGLSGTVRGRDVLDGGDGNDKLFGGALEDTLIGGAGDDELSGDGGPATVSAVDQADDYLDGGDGDDKLWGNGGADTLIGGLGADILSGDSLDTPQSVQGDDLLDGGEGNDQLIGGGGSDTLIGGSGDDVISGNEGNDQIDAGTGVNTVSGGEGNDIIFGGDDLDTITGGTGNDIIGGAGGADIIDGNEGDDYIDGEAGLNQLLGGLGNDTLIGGEDSDSIYGGADNDRIEGRGGIDTLYGNDGNDIVLGGADADTVSGGNGNDTLEGGDENDIIYGGEGNDLISGGLGADTLYGNAGDDIFRFSSADLQPVAGQTDRIIDAEGSDVVAFTDGFASTDVTLTRFGSDMQLSSSSGASLSIAGQFSGSSSIREFQFSDGQTVSAARLIGERYTSALNITNSNAFANLLGGVQIDFLNAYGADAEISGGLGNDVLSGSTLQSTTYCFSRGDGNDRVSDMSTQAADGSGPKNALELADIGLDKISVEVKDGTEVSIRVADDGGSIRLMNLTGAGLAAGSRVIDEFRFADGSTMTWTEVLSARGVDIKSINSFGGALLGTDFSDRITGNSYAETITSGAGDDRIDGGGGNDILAGEAGSDTYVFGLGSGQDTINNADTAADKVDRLLIDAALAPSALRFVRHENALLIQVTGTADGVRVEDYFAAAGLDRIEFSDGTVYTPANVPLASIAAQITTGNDQIVGSPDNETIDALAGDDVVRAGSGNDIVLGNDGNDTLYGENGNDSLDGGNGYDTLYGGGGDDTLTDFAGNGMFYGDDGDDQISGNGNLYGGVGNDSLNGSGYLYGEEGDDVLVLTDGYGTLSGGNGNDQLIGGNYLHGDAGDDILVSGDNGTLYGDAGNDTYVVGRGKYVDIFQDDNTAGRIDTLRFGPDILPSQISFEGGSSGTLYIHVAANGSLPASSVTLYDFLADDALTKKLDRIVFDADPATVWTTAQIEAMAMSPSDEDQYIRGTAGNDTLAGLGGSDSIFGRAGNDTLQGGADNDTLDGDSGNDTLIGGADNDSLRGGVGSDTYIYNLGDGGDSINEVFDAAPESIDILQFGVGIAPAHITIRRPYYLSPDLQLTIRDPVSGAVSGSVSVYADDNSVSGNQVIDEVRFTDASGTVWSMQDLRAISLIGGEATDYMWGFSSNDVLRGNGGDDSMDGAAGNDDLSGGAGIDQLVGGSGDDTYHFGHGQGYDEVYDTLGMNRIVLDAGITAADVALYRTSSPDPVNRWSYTNSSDSLVLVLNGSAEQMWVDNFFGTATPRPISQIVFADGTVWDAAAIDAHTVNQAGTANTVTGTTSDNQYIVDHRNDVINESANGGIDSVTSSVTYTLSANVENLTLTGILNLNGTGNALSNTLVGNGAANILDGMQGIDTMSAGAGDDLYVVDTVGSWWFTDGGWTNFTDIVTEQVNQGYDTIRAANVYSAVLPDNVEKLEIWGIYNGGTSYNATMDVRRKFVGNALNNVIDASLASNVGFTGIPLSGEIVIDGGAGADLMIAANLLTRFIVDDTNDVVVGGNRADDRVQTTISYTLPDGVEYIELAGSAAISATGNAGANRLDGRQNTSANQLIGGLGDDTYYLGNGDTYIEAVGGGSDTLMREAVAGNPWNIFDINDYSNIENLTVTDAALTAALRGNDADNRLTGNSSDNELTGGLGNDQLIGGAGDDNYYVTTSSGMDLISDSGGNSDWIRFSEEQNTDITQLQFSRQGNDLIIAAGPQGVLQVQSWFTSVGKIENLSLYDQGLRYVYSAAQIENRVLGVNTAPVFQGLGSWSTDSGQPFSAVVPENAFSDIESQHTLNYTATLDDGSPLPSWLSFDTQSRTFSGTPSAGDEGSFSVLVTTTDASGLTGSGLVTLEVFPPTIYGTAGDDILTGDETDNYIDGLTGNDVLNGLEGWDYLNGGSGDDSLYGDDGEDYLDDYEGGNDSMYGGADNDYMYDFGGGDDLLDGGAGVDEMWGGAGSDIYIVDDVNDTVQDDFYDSGIDEVRASVSVSLTLDPEAFVGVDNLTLLGSTAIDATGNSGNNVLTGNSGNNILTGLDGNDTLDGGTAGTDSLRGGLGNDLYLVDRSSGISITENSGQGTDEVRASVTYTLGSNLENLTLTGSSAINGTGNTLANVITGNIANNTLNGGTGADTLIGRGGNDTYTVDNIGDAVTEFAAEGTDLVNASVTYTLANEVENLTLTGSSALNGTGNALDNALTGNSGNNTLTGLGGNDTFNPGSAGTDALIGGLGNDTYTVTRSTGITIAESANEGTDQVNASVTYTLGNNLENLTLTGSTAINGTGNTLNNVLTGNSGSNTLTGSFGNDTLDPGSAGTDSLRGGLGNDTYTANRSTGITMTENANEGIDTVNSSVTRTLATNIEVLFLTGTTAINGTGNTLNNLLRGNTGNNLLAGAAGVDILEGGGGTDTLSDSGGNTLLNGGAGTDTLTGTANNDLLIGGTGNDALTTGAGADLIAFNKGDGQDTVAVSTTQDNTLAVGGGAVYADLLFQKSGNDLILKVGATDQITFTGYYTSTANRSVDKLQVVIEGTADYASGSSDPTRNKKIETFDFDGLVAAFDTARAANPSLTTWALTNALTAQHLSGSDTAAIGGDLSYRYGRFGTLSDVSFTPALGILGAAGFGSSAQNLQAFGSLQDSTPRLS